MEKKDALIQVVLAMQGLDGPPNSVHQLARNVTKASRFLFPPRSYYKPEDTQELLQIEAEALLMLANRYT